MKHEEVKQDEATLNWVAGFFEGEGHASIQWNEYQGYYPIMVNLASSDPEPIDMVYSIWGGRRVTRPTKYRGTSGKFRKGRPQHQLWFRHRESARFLDDILLHLRTQGKRAAVGIVLRALRGEGSREELYRELRELESYHTKAR